MGTSWDPTSSNWEAERRKDWDNIVTHSMDTSLKTTGALPGGLEQFKEMAGPIKETSLADAGLKTPDATDEAIRKARVNAFLRMQTGKNQGNSMGQKLGSFDVGKPVLGGY